MGLEARNEALANRDACVVIVQGVEAIVWIDPRGLGSMNSFLPHESSNPLRGRGLEVVIDLAKKNAWARRNKSTLQTSQVGKSRSHYLLFSLQLILPLHTSSYKLIRAKLGADGTVKSWGSYGSRGGQTEKRVRYRAIKPVLSGPSNGERSAMGPPETSTTILNRNLLEITQESQLRWRSLLVSSSWVEESSDVSLSLLHTRLSHKIRTPENQFPPLFNPNLPISPKCWQSIDPSPLIEINVLQLFQQLHPLTCNSVYRSLVETAPPGSPDHTGGIVTDNSKPARLIRRHITDCAGRLRQRSILQARSRSHPEMAQHGLGSSGSVHAERPAAGVPGRQRQCKGVRAQELQQRASDRGR